MNSPGPENGGDRGLLAEVHCRVNRRRRTVVYVIENGHFLSGKHVPAKRINQAALLFFLKRALGAGGELSARR